MIHFKAFCAISLLGILSFLPLHSQVSISYFSDAEVKEGDRVYDHVKDGDFLIFSGRSFERVKYSPSITKIDTLGNVVWSTAIRDTTHHYSSDQIQHFNYAPKLLKSGNFLYAACMIRSMYQYTQELWKIDISTGDILWKKEFNNRQPDYAEHIVDLDSNRLVVTYHPDSPTGTAPAVFVLVDKQNGDTLGPHVIRGISGRDDRFGMAADSDGNLYYTGETAYSRSAVPIR